MSAPSVPIIPPRPSRSPHSRATDQPTTDIPKMPPRPVNRRLDRSMSPSRDSFAPSPLNDHIHSTAMMRTTSRDLPPRPPSVTIPSLGEEGIEYADLPTNDTTESVPATTRNINPDLYLHAPKPSLPTASAHAKVQAVTHSDPGQGAASGIGVTRSARDETERSSRSLNSRTNGSRAASSTASDHRKSLQLEEEHGIPEIGQRVPINPNLGDVQAPSPVPPSSAGPAAHRPGRHHQRTRSGRETNLPPGSYGLRGHGVTSTDKFEKAWYEKHPDEYFREEKGQYSSAISPRPDWALSRDDLNKIVRAPPEKTSGVAASPATGTPEEEIGYIASEEYVARLTSPPPSAGKALDNQPPVESPLRNMSFPAMEHQRSRGVSSRASSEAGDVIHVTDAYRQSHHPDGWSHTPEPADTLDIDSEDDDDPILAADEVRPESAYLHPAVPPVAHRGSTDMSDLERFRSRTPSAPGSRPSSRPVSMHGAPLGLSRYNSRGEEYDDSYTPLEDVEEYEPLFPEEGGKSGLALPTAERFKRPADLLKHRFPSQDIWEDTPDSLQLQASVSTPEISNEEPRTKTSKSPAPEADQRTQVETLDSHQIVPTILESSSQLLSRPTRPARAKQRFPSQDIWEDAPESQRLVATIEPDNELTSSKPTIPPRPPRVKKPDAVTDAVDTSSLPNPPQKSAFVGDERETSPTEARKVPGVPDRPKPQVPARPSKFIQRESPENEIKDAVSPPKSKPAVPARPVGGKIAGLRANFLSDLNARLQLGPQAPKPSAGKKDEDEDEEVPEQKGPLSDARKGRARGPARRKPGPAIVEHKLPSIPEIKIMDAWNVWEVDMSGHLVVGAVAKTPTADSSQAPAVSDTPEGRIAPLVAKDVPREPVDPPETEKQTEPSHEAVNELENIATIEAAKEEQPLIISDHAKVSPVDIGPVIATPVIEHPEGAEEEKVVVESEPEVEPTGSPPTISKGQIEAMAASTDGKHPSDGEIHLASEEGVEV